jgi:dethiobiotin synthetase
MEALPMGPKTERYFIVGTDTGVGKTVLSLMLMQYFYAKGRDPFYLKPFQTGCADPLDTESDARFIYEHVKELQKKDPSDSVIYCFKNPKAPYFAARDEGRERDIRPERILDIIQDRERSSNPLVIEGAGGLMVPMDEHTLMMDLVVMTQATAIVAARAGLGTINHTILTLEALKGRGVTPVGVVFLDSGETPTAQGMVRENMEAVERISGVKVSGVINRVEDFNALSPEFFVTIENLLGSGA